MNPLENYVRRGGGWFGTIANHFMRVANSYGHYSTGRGNGFGFRAVLNPRKERPR